MCNTSTFEKQQHISVLTRRHFILRITYLDLETTALSQSSIYHLSNNLSHDYRLLLIHSHRGNSIPSPSFLFLKRLRSKRRTWSYSLSSESIRPRNKKLKAAQEIHQLASTSKKNTKHTEHIPPTIKPRSPAEYHHEHFPHLSHGVESNIPITPINPSYVVSAPLSFHHNDLCSCSWSLAQHIV